MNQEILCKLGVSKIHGVGVFAIRDIKKGTELFKFTSAKIPLDYKELDDKSLSVILDRNVIYNDTKEVEHPNFEINYTAFMNHSDDPNSDGVVALRDILEGEEITEDYRHDNMASISKEHFHFLWN